MTLDQILEMSFDEIDIAAELVAQVEVKRINMILEPIVTGIGGKWEPATSRPATSSKKRKKNKSKSKMSPEERDARILSQLAMLGIPVYDS